MLASPAFHDAALPLEACSGLPEDVDEILEEVRWEPPSPAVWGLLALALASLGPVAFALVLAAG